MHDVYVVISFSSVFFLLILFTLLFPYRFIMNIKCYIMWIGFYNYHFPCNGHSHLKKSVTLGKILFTATVMRSIKNLPEIMCDLRDPNLCWLLSTLMFIFRRNTLHLFHFQTCCGDTNQIFMFLRLNIGSNKFIKIVLTVTGF